MVLLSLWGQHAEEFGVTVKIFKKLNLKNCPEMHIIIFAAAIDLF